MLALLRWLAAWLGPRRPQPSHTDPTPIPQPAPPPAWARLTPQDRDAVIRTLYGEARGEPVEGQIAVVHVIRNRAARRRTNAYVECHWPAQFTCWDDQLAKLMSLSPGDLAYLRLGEVVDRAWMAPDVTGGALHYFAPAGMPGGQPPRWAAQGRETLRVGGHVFLAGVPW